MEGPHRILLVDDDPDARDVLGEFFTDEGFIVETAPDGATALDKLRRFGADLVVTDLEMPGMDGVELIRRIRDRYPERLTLLVTARREDVEEQALPAAACLHKPVDLEDLLLVIRMLIAQREAQPEAAARTALS